MTVATSLVLLTPAGAIVCLAAVVPVSAAVLAVTRTRRVRAALGLSAPAGEIDLVAVAALAASVLLLGLAAAQPALARESSRRIRTDVQALFVVDISRSMDAAPGANAATRLDRARDAVRALRGAIPEVESGVATLTDRVLPDLLPVADVASFDRTVERSVRIEQPPPRSTALRATSYGALEDVAAGNYFAPSTGKRLLVLITDGESEPFDEARVARALARSRISLETVRTWGSREAIFDSSGRPDPAYRPDPRGALALSSLASAAGGRAFDEGELGAATADLRRGVGDGPTRSESERERDDLLLAPVLATLALVPLILLASRHGARGRRSTAPIPGSYHLSA